MNEKWSTSKFIFYGTETDFSSVFKEIFYFVLKRAFLFDLFDSSSDFNIVEHDVLFDLGYYYIIVGNICC